MSESLNFSGLSLVPKDPFLSYFAVLSHTQGLVWRTQRFDSALDQNNWSKTVRARWPWSGSKQTHLLNQKQEKCQNVQGYVHEEQDEETLSKDNRSKAFVILVILRQENICTFPKCFLVTLFHIWK